LILLIRGRFFVGNIEHHGKGLSIIFGRPFLSAKIVRKEVASAFPFNSVATYISYQTGRTLTVLLIILRTTSWLHVLIMPGKCDLSADGQGNGQSVVGSNYDVNKSMICLHQEKYRQERGRHYGCPSSEKNSRVFIVTTFS
jgi:hypothetical protein